MFCRRTHYIGKPGMSIVIHAYKHPSILHRALVDLHERACRGFRIIMMRSNTPGTRQVVHRRFSSLGVICRTANGGIKHDDINGQTLSLTAKRCFGFLSSSSIFCTSRLRILINRLAHRPTCGTTCSLTFRAPVLIRSEGPCMCRLLKRGNVYGARYYQAQSPRHLRGPTRSMSDESFPRGQEVHYLFTTPYEQECY